MTCLLLLVLLYLGAALIGYCRRDLSRSRYPSPQQAMVEIEALARAYPALCRIEEIGRSSEGRSLMALRLRGCEGDEDRPALLVTAHIHAIEYIGSYVARAVARCLTAGYGKDVLITGLLDRADVWIVPLLNPDGAERIWRNGGWTGLGGSRFTANGVDPNRNFPFVEIAGRPGWNSARTKPGSAYYRGPHPLSEPECLALARLCARERFCAAVNFHSFSAVVFLPSLEPLAPGPERARAAAALAVFEGVFQSRQSHRQYRPIPERSAAIVGQLDPFLLNGLGTPSVTIEVSRPHAGILLPWRLPHFFSWANPADPDFWAQNDADATIIALDELLTRTGGQPIAPPHPELAATLPPEMPSRAS